MTIFKQVYYAVVNLVQLRNCTAENICAFKKKKKKKVTEILSINKDKGLSHSCVTQLHNVVILI